MLTSLKHIIIFCLLMKFKTFFRFYISFGLTVLFMHLGIQSNQQPPDIIILIILILNYQIWFRDAVALFFEYFESLNFEWIKSLKNNYVYHQVVSAFPIEFSIWGWIGLSIIVCASSLPLLDNLFIAWRTFSGIVLLRIVERLFNGSRYASSVWGSRIFYCFLIFAHYDYWAGIGISKFIREHGPKELHFIKPHYFWGRWSFEGTASLKDSSQVSPAGSSGDKSVEIKDVNKKKGLIPKLYNNVTNRLIDKANEIISLSKQVNNLSAKTCSKCCSCSCKNEIKPLP